MSKTMCPGQNTRFWKPEDIFEANCPYCGATARRRFGGGVVHINCPSCNRRYQSPIAKRVTPLPDDSASIDRLIQLTKTESSLSRIYDNWCQVISIDPYHEEAWSQLLHLAEQDNNHRLYAIILRNFLLIDPYVSDNFKKMAEILTYIGLDKRATKYSLKAEHLERSGISQSIATLPQDVTGKSILGLMTNMKRSLSDEFFLKIV